MIVYGKQIILHLLEHQPQRIEQIFLAKDLPPKLFARITALGLKIIRLDPKKAQAMARGGNHQGFLAQISPLLPSSPSELLKSRSLVVLCGVSDVGNVGSIARTCHALGVEGIVFLGEFSAKAMESIVRLSSGAMLDLPFACYPLGLEFIHRAKQAGFVCLGAEVGGEEIADLSLEGLEKWALFLGSEGFGLGSKIAQKMDKITSIDMHNGFDSLNVGVACGILVHRLVRNARK